MTTPIGSFQGLASGINWADMIDQIIQADSQPITLLQSKSDDIDRKEGAWTQVQYLVQALDDKATALSDGTLFNTYLTSVTGMSGTSAPVSVSASSSAVPGSYTLDVLQMATREKVASNAVDDHTAAMGVSGEFVVGGRAVTVSATDSMDDLALAVNRVNTGSDASGVSAAVVAASGGGYRLVLTAASTGAAGIQLADGSGGALESLGFLDGTTAIRNATSDGAKSDAFQSSTTAVGTLLGLSSPPPSAAVGIGGLSVTVDLSTASLDDIASAINTAASAASSPITAQVVDDTDASGNTVKRLDISGTTSFTDAGGILQTLGVLEGGRAAVAQQVESDALTDGDASTAATASTLLTNLWAGGSDSAVQVGDTLTLSGTRGDGTTFTKTFTVGVASTYQDLVDALNSASDAFGSGSRTATASLSADGRIVVTDDSGGDSRLALSIVAHNEGGGSLNFGDVSTVARGRDRELTAGVDAQFNVDGVFFSRSSNTVSDVIQGATLTLEEASQEDVTVTIDRDIDSVASAVSDFVSAYNDVAKFVNGQFAGTGVDGNAKQPLSGDAIVRQMRDQLRNALSEAVSSSVTDVSRLSDLGITMNRDGVYDVDMDTLKSALASDALSVQRFFSVYGVGSTGSLDYIGSSDATQSGNYDVVVSTLATRAQATGSGFGGTYVDDGTGDTMTVTDTGTGSAYSVTLTNGMTLSEIVDALNTELQTDTYRTIEASASLSSDAVGTAATDATLLQDLHDSSGNALGVADGDTFTISGNRSDGTSFFQDFVVTDTSSQTLGDLRAAISDALGTSVDVSFQNGVLTATSVDAGRKTFTLSVSSDNAGGGSFSFGSLDVTEVGRGKASITASDSGGELQLTHTDYGSAAGLDVAFTAGGTDGSASLGLAAGSYAGTDVAGTIGGQSATGAGRLLVADSGTTAEGLEVRYTGSSTGTVGSLRFSRGVASAVQLIADAQVDPNTGSLKGVVDSLDTQKQDIATRIADIQKRLDQRKQALTAKFTALEEAMAKAQQQMSWLQAQLGSVSQSGG